MWQPIARPIVCATQCYLTIFPTSINLNYVSAITAYSNSYHCTVKMVSLLANNEQ